MRFLCLHGHGTNSSILKTQLQALTRKLDSDNEYIYIDAELQVEKARGLPISVSGPYLGWYNQYTPEQICDALDIINDAVEEEGPFDGVIAFSQGASLTLSYLMHHEMESCGKPSPFGFAVLFSPFVAVSSNATLYDDILSKFGTTERKRLEDFAVSRSINRTNSGVFAGSSRSHELKDLLDAILSSLEVGFQYDFIGHEDYDSIITADDLGMLPRVLVPSLIKQRISIPIVHVIGTKDEPLFKEQAESVKGLCKPNLLRCIKHRNGHDVPNGPDVAEVIKGIEWAVSTSAINSW